MKLIEKKEILAAQNLDRKRDVEEGHKLASKVDALRKLAADEQANLLKFSRETLRKVHSDIDSNISERDSIKREVDQLKEARATLQVPLDAEWHKIENEKKIIEENKTSIAILSSGLDSRASSITENEKQLSVEENRIQELKEATEKRLRQIDEKEKELTKILEESLQRDLEFNSESRQRLERIEKKESELKYREVDLDSKAENIRIQVEEISLARLKIKDKEGELERAFKRLK